MKQPEVFKNFKDSWNIKNQIYNYDEERIKELNKVIDKATEEVNGIKSRIARAKKEEEEVLKYFDYLDSLEQSKH